MACITPYYVDNPAYPHSSMDRQIPVPCGRCPNCLKRRVSQWSFRLMHELRNHKTAHFYTLTYDSEHIPITNNGFMSLRKVDFQCFMKRLRKLHDVKIKYYMCGEYGTHSKRPHYHVIMFGSRPEHVQREWYFGSVHVGNVGEASVAYTLKYINKGKCVPAHKRDDREPEKALMSKGMGLNFITPAIRAYYLMHPLEVCVYSREGYRVSMPRYYKDRIFNEFQKLRQNIEQGHRVEEIQRLAEQSYIDQYGSLDGYDSMIDERKIACLRNFKKRLLARDF